IGRRIRNTSLQVCKPHRLALRRTKNARATIASAGCYVTPKATLNRHGSARRCTADIETLLLVLSSRCNLETWRGSANNVAAAIQEVHLDESIAVGHWSRDGQVEREHILLAREHVACRGDLVIRSLAQGIVAKGEGIGCSWRDLC